MSLIYKTIVKAGNTTREVKKARGYNQQEDNKLKVELSNNTRNTKKVLVDNEIDNQNTDNELRVNQLKIKQERATGHFITG